MDGSRVLGYVPPGWYLADLRDGVRKILEGARKNTDVKDFMLLYGAGDHGGGPRDTDIAAIKKYRNDPNEPRLEFDVPETYFKRIIEQAAGCPIVVYNPLFWERTEPAFAEVVVPPGSRSSTAGHCPRSVHSSGLDRPTSSFRR